MNEYLFYAAIALGVLLVALLVPGLKVLAEAVLKSLGEFLGELLKHKMTFVVWAVKTLFSDHARVLKHAVKSRYEIDPTQRIRRKADGYDD